MVAIHTSHRAFKRTMRLALLAQLLVALFDTVEQAAQLRKATRLVSRHNGLLTQDTIRQVGSIGIKPHQRHNK